jgi:hypothetical protein
LALLHLLFGYIGGIIIVWITGDLFPYGLNLLLNTTRFNEDNLPLVAGTLAAVGSYFKAYQHNHNS